MRLGLLLLLASTILLTGCMGGAPQQRFLNIADTELIAAGGNTAKPNTEYMVAIRDFEDLPALDRTSVLFARGRVLTPSHSWYWEGVPAEILTMTVAERISRSDRITSVWPYRPRVKRDAIVTGRVLTFAADLSSPARFKVALALELWSGGGDEKLAEKIFTAERDLPGFGLASAGDPEVLAGAAGGAVRALGDEVRAWLEENRLLIAKQ